MFVIVFILLPFTDYFVELFSVVEIILKKNHTLSIKQKIS